MSLIQSAYSRPKKRFGQHFLHDQNVIYAIISAMKALPDDPVIEIGPGQGALTFPLLSQLHRLFAIELDRDLIPQLRAQGGQKLQLLEQDILSVDFNALSNLLNAPKQEAQYQKLRIVGNLPYNISTPILFHLLQYKNLIADMHFMLQKEVVERLAATPGSKTYGRLSLMIQVHCEVTPLFTVPPSAFTPPPKVDSMVVRLKPYVPARFNLKAPERFAELVKLAFQTRRKTLKNALKSLELDLPMNLAGLRAENLSIDDYIYLSEH